MPTDYSSDAANYDDEPFTMGQLCAALDAGRMFAALHDGAYEISHAQLRRWQREETLVRALLGSVDDASEDGNALSDDFWLTASDACETRDALDTTLDTSGPA